MDPNLAGVVVIGIIALVALAAIGANQRDVAKKAIGVIGTAVKALRHNDG
jgi:hypothetical protein